MAGFALGAAGFVLYGIAPVGWGFACALPLTGFWGIAGASIQSAMSRHVESFEQGELQGAIGSIRSIATIVGPPFFTLVFAAVTAHAGSPFIGAPWYCGALLLGFAAFFARRGLARDPASDAALGAAV